MGLKLKDVPAAAGLQWVRQGFTEFWRQPMAYTGLFVVFLLAYIVVLALSSLASMLSALFAYMGVVVLLMGVPLLTLAFVMGAHTAQHGKLLHAGVYLVPWRQKEPDRRRALLILLGAYALLTVGALELAAWLDDGAFDALMEASMQSKRNDEEFQRLASAPGVLTGVLTRGAFAALLSVPFWHAPALVFWGGQGPAQAMFSSLVAVWRARAAFVLYGLGWLGAIVAACVVAVVLSGVLGAQWAGLVVMPIMLMLSAAFYVSLYFSFRDSFGEP